MKAIQLEKVYNPKDFETRIYDEWEKSGSFKPRSDTQKNDAAGGKRNAFVVVIPPPNVTGVLHLGHALNMTLQDIVVRYHRMKGDNTLWLPGTDHAGIATQHVVEKRLKAEGTRRQDLGREAFLERTWQVKNEHHEIISNQMRKLGNSVDWSRERFTMDEGLSEAVREVFVTLYERGLIYRGNYLVNWCPSCGTALADDEVEHTDTTGKMYHIYYELAQKCSAFPEGRVEVATTRPETLFGDTAIAVNPKDERYKELVGQLVKLPLTGKLIPVIADNAVDKDFGTGVLKITPAHAAADWETGARHKLPIVNVLNPDGTLNENVPEKYRGINAQKSRAIIEADLAECGLLAKTEKITHPVGHCYRCNHVVEPYVSDQWFVKMQPLAEKALALWQKGEVVFYPKKWENTYTHWLTNIRDWCISRQLWWGHRIPVWYCESCGEMTVSRTDVEKCPKCGGNQLRQDEDVLDTWFSSWLWPFSTLGWPQKTQDLADFYPTTALVTGFDIIFFWVARMIMAGAEFTGRSPFRDIFINGLVRDGQGRKMSKTLGNGIDPLDLIAEYGSDALKFTLAFMCAQGQDVSADKEAFKLGSRFANKIWNASRYILGNLEGRTIKPLAQCTLIPLDVWLFSRLDACAKNMSEAFETYRYNDAANSAYEFFWNDFCDWYVEATKLSFRLPDDSDDADGTAEKDRAASVLLAVLEKSLRLLHPLLPFVTEEIYSFLPLESMDIPRSLLINAAYPSGESSVASALAAPAEPAGGARTDAVRDFALLQTLVKSVRSLRAECALNAQQKVPIAIKSNAQAKDVFESYRALIELLANASKIEFTDSAPQKAIGEAASDFEIFLLIMEGSINADSLRGRFSKEIENESAFAKKIEQKLSGTFADKAPAAVVAEEREKLARAQERIEKLKNYLASL
ncbi:MAG: valine--tRNA ligase [Treponemataceae bacterium]|nr:MAG: valine--tRNA ligase [Treponemataceae bacterium]